MTACLLTTTPLLLLTSKFTILQNYKHMFTLNTLLLQQN